MHQYLVLGASTSSVRELMRTTVNAIGHSWQVDAAEAHVVPEVSGREHAARTSSYPNVGTSGSGTAPRERLREPTGVKTTPDSTAGGSAGGSSTSSGGGYPNVGTTGLGTAPRERVFVR